MTDQKNTTLKSLEKKVDDWLDYFDRYLQSVADASLESLRMQRFTAPQQIANLIEETYAQIEKTRPGS